MSKVQPDTEQELAAVVVAWLQGDGWDVYQEVRLASHDCVADIVAVKDGRAWVIECKLSMSMAVIEQADGWRMHSHWSSIAIPRPKKHYDRCRNFAYSVCKWRGVGVITTHRGTVDDYCIQPPQLNRTKGAGAMLAVVNQHHKTYAKAGSAEGGYWTPFAQTCKELEKYVRAHPGCPFKEAIGGIAHHYHKDSTALSCLRKWAGLGKVRGVRLVTEGRRLTLQPSIAVHP
jgi:hypothetical protein